jgi:prepilin-type N-terminal cleavage/methylation domain-containing protein
MSIAILALQTSPELVGLMLRPLACRNLNAGRRGLTLVEVLVAISVIGIVAALSLPAVQRAREASRQTECKNNLRQIALACTAHADAHRHMPSGGWGWWWIGDPDRGFDHRQPGGWTYNILPYLEQQALRKMGSGLPWAQKADAGRQVAETALPVFNCPSRRAAVPYPFVHPADFVNIDRPHVAGRSDYAANVGDLAPELYGPGPGSLAEGDSRRYRWEQVDRTGVIYRRSVLRPAHIRDGLAQTYLVAEAYLDRDQYTTGEGTNDDQGMFVGYDRDTLRVTHPAWPPLRDRRGVSSAHSFGSAHAEAFHAAFCDGSVRSVRYTISTEVYRRLGHRADGQAVDLSAL